MYHDEYDDIALLAERLRLGIPLRGFDGREIPLRDRLGRPVLAIESAIELLESAVVRLDPATARSQFDTVFARAADVETAAIADGADDTVVVAKVVAVLVSAAVRANVVARSGDASPSDLNRATLGWYQVSQMRRQELLAADRSLGEVGRIA